MHGVHRLPRTALCPMRPRSDLSFRPAITVRPAVVSGERCHVSSIEGSMRRSLRFLSGYTHRFQHGSNIDSNTLQEKVDLMMRRNIYYQGSTVISAWSCQTSGHMIFRSIISLVLIQILAWPSTMFASASVPPKPLALCYFVYIYLSR